MRGVSRLGVTLGVSIIMGYVGIARADSLATLCSLSALREHGVMFHVQHTNETQAMIGSPTPGLGLEKGVGNVGIFTYGSDIDWERLAGLQGVSTHIILASGYGSPTSHKFGDFLNPSQATYGGVGNVVIHLVSAYVEKSMLYDRVSAAVGRMTFLSDFSANPLYCNFMNGAFCGNPRAASDNKAHAPFPMSNWATRVRVQITDEMAIKTGLYLTETEAIYTHHQTRTGFKFNGATIDGMALPLEVSWTPAFGPRKGLSGLYKLGFVYDTARHDSRFEGMGGAEPLSGQRSATPDQGGMVGMGHGGSDGLALQGARSRCRTDPAGGGLLERATHSPAQGPVFSGVVHAWHDRLPPERCHRA
ncbi:carbohydrate-selective porin OprB [Asaia bogorensis NBRC 16594]|nr:carbohydrate-selective porin OprB [Asaia bogorensis NBRC 16594]